MFTNFVFQMQGISNVHKYIPTMKMTPKTKQDFANLDKDSFKLTPPECKKVTFGGGGSLI